MQVCMHVKGTLQECAYWGVNKLKLGSDTKQAGEKTNMTQLQVN